MSEEEKTVIELESNQVALIINEGWDMQIVLPKIGDEDPVPNHVLYATALSILTSEDEEFVTKIIERFFEDYVGDVDEELEKE